MEEKKGKGALYILINVLVLTNKFEIRGYIQCFSFHFVAIYLKIAYFSLKIPIELIELGFCISQSS